LRLLFWLRWYEFAVKHYGNQTVWNRKEYFMKLNEAIVLISGSTRGFGNALARALLAKVAKVVLSGREQQTVERVAAELSALGEVCASPSSKIWRFSSSTAYSRRATGCSACCRQDAFQRRTEVNR
jgi:NAD(P)-dependent dehydrogenase (short-subunit alcohol dehydrogenase family)